MDVPVFAVLHPGDMGARVAAALSYAGYPVLACTSGRSIATGSRAAQHGLPEAASLTDIARNADVVISLVPPSAVLPMAYQYLQAAAPIRMPARYIDMNAKSFQAVSELSTIFNAAHVPFTNACVIGRAEHLGDEGLILTSGESPASLNESLSRICRVRHLGSNLHAATAFKSCFGGFNKSITAALFETAAVANHFGFIDELFVEITNKLPGVMSDLATLIGTYPQHIERRAAEMRAVGDTLEGISLAGHTVVASAKVFKEIADRGDFDKYHDADPDMLTLLKSVNPSSSAAPISPQS